jgi:hypothetical protein
MAAITAASAGNFNTAGTWNDPGGGARVPTTGDTANPNGYGIVIDGNVTCDGFVGNENVGHFHVDSGSPTVTLAVSGIVSSSTLTAGFIQVAADATLNLVGGGSGKILITNTAAGYAIVTAGSAVLNVTNTNGTAVSVAAGRCISSAGTGAVTIVGNILQGAAGAGTGRSVYITSTSTSHSITGSMVQSSYGCCLEMNATGGRVTLSGTSSVYSQTYNSSQYSVVQASVGTIAISGNRTVAAGELWCFGVWNSGTLNLTDVTFTNNGKLFIHRMGASGTLTVSNTAVINNTSAAEFLLFGWTSATLAATGPLIPAEADVLDSADDYGYAGDLQTGTLAAGGGGVIIVGDD